ncbi:protein brambleberry-like [Sphaerodactylus townsendi]|uniref:protein brambleberry-like n=1 Tax=Sphaerodactylus townsendi TaxID=933632 RepID=UPI0020262C93|nr:protein brambleberry-like [Sphaerodactylus townsendi]
MSCLSGQDHTGREYSAQGEELLPDRGSALHSAGWTSQQGHSLHAMSLRRVGLIRCPRHEATLERAPGQHLSLDCSSFASSRAGAPNESLMSDISSCSASPRMPCQGVTKTGQPCRKKAALGHVFCRVHTSAQASYTS